MAFCFSGSLVRANFNIVFFLVLYCYCLWQINFFFFYIHQHFLSSTDMVVLPQQMLYVLVHTTKYCLPLTNPTLAIILNDQLFTSDTLNV